MLNELVRFTLLALAAAWLPVAHAEPPELPLAQAIVQALQQHPALAVKQAQVAAAQSRVVQQGSLPEPRLSVNLSNLPVDSFSLSEEPMTQVQLGLSQPLPYPGKRGLLAAQAQSAAQAGEQELAELRLQIAGEVQQIWWQRYAVDRAREILRYNLTLMRQLVAIAQTKYKVGQGLQQDVLLAQLELSKLLEREIALDSQATMLETRLNRLLGQPADQPIRLPAVVDESLPTLLPLAQLQEQARATRPQLQAQVERVQGAERGVELARREYFPDFQVGVVYGQRSGRTDMASLQFSMNLPLYTASRQDPLLNQRTSELLSERYRLVDAQSQIQARIGALVAGYQATQAQVGLLKSGIIPQARQTVDSMTAGYQVSKVDFLNLARAQITLFDYETQYWQLISQAQQTLAALQSEVGKESVYE